MYQSRCCSEHINMKHYVYSIQVFSSFQLASTWRLHNLGKWELQRCMRMNSSPLVGVDEVSSHLVEERSEDLQGITHVDAPVHTQQLLLIFSHRFFKSLTLNNQVFILLLPAQHSTAHTHTLHWPSRSTHLKAIFKKQPRAPSQMTEN